MGGWENAIGAVLVFGDSSAVSGEFVAGFQRDADALSCLAHVIRPDLVEIFVGNRRDWPYLTSCSYVLSELEDMAIQKLAGAFGEGVVSLHPDGLICSKLENAESLMREAEGGFSPFLRI